MVITTQFEVDVGWGKIAGQIFGKQDAAAKNAKPIFALHGFLDNSNSFRPLASYLTKNNQYYIIAIDLPGMGLSSHISNGIPYSTKFFLMTLRRVIIHFKMDKFIFMTHSFGCSLALAVSLL
jgi:pimeloyl-ACP methyl ester carboxylesterase